MNKQSCVDLKELGDEEWVELLTREYEPPIEEVVIVTRLRKPRTLSVNKREWKTLFSSYDGMDFRRGDGIEIVKKDSGGKEG